MGEVFEALDRVRDDVIAIKTLTRADGAAFARFKREFRALQSTAHPNLVSLGELVCVGDLWMFTMELVDGRHFIEHVRGDRERLRASLGQLVVGLCALHDGGLVHRDVKPSNVIVTRDGRVVILDFGLVTTLDPARQSIADGPIGTVEYMAPEQASGRQVGAAADWYSVGVMLYEALTGQMPHKGHALEILLHKQQVEPPAAHDLVPDAPRDLCVERDARTGELVQQLEISVVVAHWARSGGARHDGVISEAVSECGRGSYATAPRDRRTTVHATWGADRAPHVLYAHRRPTDALRYRERCE